MMHSQHSSQLLKYLQHGVTQTEAARALGITPSAVTQLMQSEELAPQVEELRQKQIERSAKLDERYDSIEEKLLDQLERTIPRLLKPREISGVLAQVNSAKRRGITAAAQNSDQARVVQLHLPAVITNKFTLNATNQVVAVGDQQLITMQSANIAKLAESAHAKQSSDLANELGFTPQG